MSTIASGHHMPNLADLDEGVWHEMRPAGQTTCSRGTPFAFFVRRGRTDRVLLEFMGGGACWSERTCGLERSTFNERIDLSRQLFAAYADEGAARTSASPPSAPVGEGDSFEAGIADRAGMYRRLTRCPPAHPMPSSPH